MCPLFKGLGQAHNYPPLFLTLNGKQIKESFGHKNFHVKQLLGCHLLAEAKFLGFDFCFSSSTASFCRQRFPFAP